VSLPKLAVLCDLPEERWPSMDLIADATVESLAVHGSERVEVTRIRPAMTRRLSWGDSGWAYAADRAINRFWDYPELARRIQHQADIFHIIDHSYAQLVHSLPAERTVVTCHDVDTFRCLFDSSESSRSAPVRWMGMRALSGLRKAARVCCVSEATKAVIEGAGLVPGRALRVVPNPVHPDFSAEPDAESDAVAMAMLGEKSREHLHVLHVGSTIPRKRIDLLLHVVGRVRKREPRVRIVRAGGAFTDEQRGLLLQLGLEREVVVLPPLSRRVLAAVYRRSDLVLLPSEREGFGLPVIEAMASGSAVLASDLPALREVGGDAVTFCAVGAIDEWAERALDLLDERETRPEAYSKRRELAIARAGAFNYVNYSKQLLDVYSELQ